MKKLLALTFGLLIAFAAAWAVPREIKENPVKIKILNYQITDVVMDAVVFNDIAVIQHRLWREESINQRTTLFIDHVPLNTRTYHLRQIPWTQLNTLYNTNSYKPILKLGSWKYRNRVTQHRL